MNAIAHMPTTTEMSSLEIAERTGKEHKNVTRDIETMFLELEIDRLKFERIYKDSLNRDQKCYNLDKDLTLCLISKYDTKTRMAIIKRRREVEEAGQELARAIEQADPVILRKMADMSEELNNLKNPTRQVVDQAILTEDHFLYFKSISMLSKFFKRTRNVIESVVKTNQIDYIKRINNGYEYLAYDERQIQPLIPAKAKKYTYSPDIVKVPSVRETIIAELEEDWSFILEKDSRLCALADYFNCSGKTIRRAVKEMPDFYIENSNVCRRAGITK